MSSFEDCNNFIKRLEQTLELFGQYGDHVIESFKGIAKNACEAELKCQAVELVVSNSRSYLNVEQIDKSLLENEKSGIPDPTKTQRYKNFLKKIDNIFSEQLEEESGPSHIEDEDIVMESNLVYIDPITKMPLEDPVRNKICGHNYGRESITQSLKMNSRLRCPSMGCNNRKIIQLSDLIDDEELCRKLNQRTRKNQQNIDSDDDD